MTFLVITGHALGDRARGQPQAAADPGRDLLGGSARPAGARSAGGLAGRASRSSRSSSSRRARSRSSASRTSPRSATSRTARSTRSRRSSGWRSWRCWPVLAFRFARTRAGWPLAVALSVLASPRLLMYQLSTLQATVRGPDQTTATRLADGGPAQPGEHRPDDDGDPEPAGPRRCSWPVRMAATRANSRRMRSIAGSRKTPLKSCMFGVTRSISRPSHAPVSRPAEQQREARTTRGSAR